MLSNASEMGGSCFESLSEYTVSLIHKLALFIVNEVVQNVSLMSAALI